MDPQNAMRMALRRMCTVAVVASVPVVALAQGASESQPMVSHAAALEWADLPPSLPPGGKVAVLEGDPAEAGPLTMRVRFPADYEIRPHTHPAIEHITVLEGTLNMGTGETFDRENSTELTVGSFMVLPIEMPHFAWTSEETVIQLHSTGPWNIAYVDPADDPRRGN